MRTIVDVPVELAEAVGLDEDERARKEGRDGEVARRVLDLDPPAGRHRLLLLVKVEHEGTRDLAERVRDRLVLGVAERRGRDGALEDVGILCRDVCEHRRVHAEVLRNDLKRGVREPVRKHERGARRVKVAVREDEEDLKALVERLDRVRGAGREAIFGKEHQALSMEVPKDARCRGSSLVNVRVRTLQRALDVGRVVSHCHRKRRYDQCR